MKVYEVPVEEGEGGSYATIEDKFYTCKGFEFIIREDNPPQYEDLNGEEKVLIKFLTFDGAEGPAASLSPAEFIALVHKFGGEDYTPSVEDLKETSCLIEGKEKANKAGKQLSVESKGGWARQYSLSLHIPEGKYTVKFKGAHRQDREEGNYHFTRREMGENVNEFLIFDFVVTGNALGKPSIYDGFEFSLFMTNVFVAGKNVNGKNINAEEIAQPVMVGNVTSKRWLEFARYFAPALDDYEWEVDPTKSRYGVSEVLQPQYVIINEALKADQRVVVYYEPIKGKRTTKWTVELADLSKVNERAEKVTEESSEEEYTLKDFVNVVKEIAGENIFESEDPVSFTSEGKEWAEKNLSDIWTKENGFPNVRVFTILKSSQIEQLINHLVE
jgi:hypothetical protein